MSMAAGPRTVLVPLQGIQVHTREREGEVRVDTTCDQPHLHLRLPPTPGVRVRPGPNGAAAWASVRHEEPLLRPDRRTVESCSQGQRSGFAF